MKCKYKVKTNGGEDFCGVYSEPCADLSFVCDKNCQIFEDLKTLEQKKEAIKRFKKYLLGILKLNSDCADCEGDCTFCMTGTNRETYEIAKKVLLDEVET